MLISNVDFSVIMISNIDSNENETFFFLVILSHIVSALYGNGMSEHNFAYYLICTYRYNDDTFTFSFVFCTLKTHDIKTKISLHIIVVSSAAPYKLNNK